MNLGYIMESLKILLLETELKKKLGKKLRRSCIVFVLVIFYRNMELKQLKYL